MTRVAWLYDMDACYAPTGVTRHALAQLERLSRRDDFAVTAVAGRISRPEGLDYWKSLGDLRRVEVPVRTRDLLRWWRVAPAPAMEWFAGRVDWVYCPAEFRVRTRRAKVAVTSHDVLQGFKFGSERLRRNTAEAFRRADLVLSVSHFNTARLVEAVPECAGKVAYVPNGAEDIYFEPTPAADRAAVRADLGLPDGIPYLLSVANFQPRKNLARLVRAVGRLREVAAGELALVLLGSGAPEEERALREAIAGLGPKVVARLPGYRQGPALRAAYAEATALAFPSLCESFGIPAVEAMAQGTPVALADSTALPEIGGEAGWYFDPEDDDALAEALRELLDRGDERGRRVELGRRIAGGYRWDAANDRLAAALQEHA